MNKSPDTAREMGSYVVASQAAAQRGVLKPHKTWGLQENNFAADGLRRTDSSEFQGPDPPRMDFVFTVGDKAAAAVCPVRQGQSMTAPWAVDGEDIAKTAAFHRAFGELRNRIPALVSLPLDSLNKPQSSTKVGEIGCTGLEDPRGRAS